MSKRNGKPTVTASKIEEKSTECEYTVGKGRPPKHSQYQPGQSGKPKGKEKGKLNSKTLLKMMEAELLLPRVAFKDKDGLDRKLNMIEAAVACLSKLGVHGDRGANKDIIDLAFQITKMKKDRKLSPGSLEEDLVKYRKLNAKQIKTDGNSVDDDEPWFI